MASVTWKNGRWYARLKGNKVPGKWAAYPTDYATPEQRSEAIDAAQRKQAEIDARPLLMLSPYPRPPRQKKRRARIDSHGVIYALRLLPDVAPNRIKVGFTSSSLDRRLGQHRVTCPMLEVIALWRGKRSDENRAHAALTGRLGPNEIFDVPDVDAALAALDSVLGARA